LIIKDTKCLAVHNKKTLGNL